MELKEMIKVMQHYEDGGEIEFSDDNFEKVIGKANKEDDGKLCWDWDEFDYRIKEGKQKVTIEKWLMQGDTGCCFVLEGDSSYFEGYQNITKVKLLETYEVEL